MERTTEENKSDKNNIEIEGEEMARKKVKQMPRRQQKAVMAKLQKDRAQVFNPVTKRWVKFNTKHGGIVQHKKSPGRFENVRVYRKKRR